MNNHDRGALQGAGDREVLSLPGVDYRVKRVGRIHHEVVVLSSVLYVAIVDYDFVAFVDGDPVGGKSIVRYLPDILVKRQGVIEKIERSGGRGGIANSISNACAYRGTGHDSDYAYDEQ
jgi:hypothetical protein